MKKENLNNLKNLETINNSLNSEENKTLNTTSAYNSEQTDASSIEVLSAETYSTETSTGVPVATSETVANESSDDLIELSDIVEPNISYIESDGTQYINTTIISNLSDASSDYKVDFNNIKIVVDYQLTEIATSYNKVILGFDNGTVTNTCFNICAIENSGRVCAGTSIYNAEINTTDRYEITIPFGETPTIINKSLGETLNVTLSSDTNPEFNHSLSLPLYLFAGNRQGAVKGAAKMKLYSFKAYENEELIMNLIPRYYDGKFCLYDTVKERAFYDVNGNDFAYGYETGAKKLKLTDNVILPTGNYPELNELPQINGVELVGNKTLGELEDASKKISFINVDENKYSIGVNADIDSDGNNITSNVSTVVGTKSFIDLAGKKTIKIVCNKGYAARVAFYSEMNSTTHISNTTNWQNSFIMQIPEGTNYIRILLCREDGADISTSEYYNFTLYTSVTVSILGDSVSTFGLNYYTTIDDNNSDITHKWAPEGCIYNFQDNRVRYPVDTGEIEGDYLTDVNQMWWKQVIDHFGWQLGINESWAGSRIAWDGTEPKDGHVGKDIHIASLTRLRRLGENGTPDIILIEAGGNDVNHLDLNNLGVLYTETPLETSSEDSSQNSTESSPEDSSENTSGDSSNESSVDELDYKDPADYTDEELINLNVYTFYRAVKAMLLRLQRLYPKAKILYLLPYYCTTGKPNRTTYTLNQFNNAAIEVCNLLGVDYIDLRKVINIYDINTLLSSDALHPNIAGMKAIADDVIRKIEASGLYN